MSNISAYDCPSVFALMLLNMKAVLVKKCIFYAYENRSKLKISAGGRVIALREMTLPYLAC